MIPPSRTAVKREPLSPQRAHQSPIAAAITPTRPLHLHRVQINTPESGGSPQSALMRTPSMTNPMESTSQHCALVITQQPPQKWYKDQFGRKATFDIHVQRIGQGCASCVDQRHLAVQLLYENGKMVENQNILRINSGLCLNKDDESSIAIRIMEVSKNHQNQRFRIQIALPQCPLSGATPTPAITEAVLVLSKKNKRPVKPECDEGQDASWKPKKSKCEDSPVLASKCKETASDAMSPIGKAIESAHSEMDEFSEQMAGESSWASQVVRFKSPTESVCLWANAAYNFLHKLQFQRPSGASAGDEDMDDFLGQACLTKYQCPVCHESYGSAARHRPDCDLSLLLQQSGQLDTSPQEKKEAKTPPTKQWVSHPTKELQRTFGPREERKHAAFTAPHVPPAPSAYNITQELLQFSESSGDDARPAAAFGSSSVDLMAKNLNLNSWEGYSTLSKIMFSTVNMEPIPPQSRNTAANSETVAAIKPPPLVRPGSLSSMPPALPEFQELQPSRNVSSSFSKLVSSMKDMAPDAAAFLQEHDAELNGDASLLCSLSRVSLSDFLNSEPAGSQKSDTRYFSTLSSLLSDEPKSQASEDAVAFIVGSDFRHCGYPAFDASFSLLGFYFLSGSAELSNHDLRFMPNFYPLPPEMLLELEKSVLEWRRDGKVVFARDQTPERSMTQLKHNVIQCVIAGCNPTL